MRKDSECVFLKGQYFTVSCKKLSYVKECRYLHGVRSGWDGCLKQFSCLMRNVANGNCNRLLGVVRFKNR